MKRVTLACLSLLCLAIAASAQTGLQVDDLFKIRRVSDPRISPEGKQVAYVITNYNKATNGRNDQIWLVSTTGGAARQLTTTGSNNTPRWSPDGTRLAFVSTRDGSPQVWILDLAHGGEAHKVTSISTGASGIVWSPDGQNLLFSSDVYPECPDDNCNQQKAEAAESSRVKAKVATRLLYRHWNFWKDGTRTHVFIVPASGGVAKDLTPGDWDAPPFASGNQDPYVFSPDGKSVCYAKNTDDFEAASTNSDLFVVPATGGEAKRVTGDNKGWDGSPLYSPDGRHLAYLSQARAGFEADKFRLLLLDTQSGQTRDLTASIDRSVDQFVWSSDGKTIYFTADEATYSPVFRLDVATAKIEKIIDSSSNNGLDISRDNRTLVFSRSSESMPAEAFAAAADGTGVRQLTDSNKDILGERTLSKAEDVWTTGTDGTKVHSLLYKPTTFDASRKYPLVVLIHGGPQGSWGRSFGYRWNPQIYAAQGYVVLTPNPRGSTGYGQQFTDDVSGDWGGKPYDDIMKSVDAVAAMPFVDKDRIGAAGASYGGYMVNWILGHNDDGRFKVLVSHDGVYNLRSMANGTEELWFPDWEFRGTPLTNPEMYKKFSPDTYGDHFKTPTLVVHGELDYRVPIGQGIELFTQLQRQKVPSKLLYFPDEGHWVLKPQNSEFWYHTVLDWLATYLKK